MANFPEALKSEITRLERQLSENPTYKLLRDLRRVAEMYSDGDSEDPPRAMHRARDRSPPGISAGILDAAKEFLAGRREPTPTKIVMEGLKERGVYVGGALPQNTVSSMLSKSEEFVSHGRTGWTLAVPAAQETEKVGDAALVQQPSPTLLDRRIDQPTEPHGEGRETRPGGGT